MCGFVGYWNSNGETASEPVLRRMLERIRYRGPDDVGTWLRGPIGLGHVRLSIIDLSPRGHQPFVTDDGQGVIVYNGEVYNFREIRANLEAEGFAFKSSSDTEVVLCALHHWGPEKAIPLFNGMFGFAYFDLRDKSIWLARDRAGIKPLYVARMGDLIAFASEMKALLAHPDVPCRPDVHVLGSFLTYQRFEGDWTPFEGIEQVSPGSYWKITQKGIEKTVYFDPVRDLNIDRLLEFSKQDPRKLVTEFERALSESVRMHLVSDAPLATMCSGGVDSSLVTALASEFKPDLVAYVANVKGTLSEGAKAQLVAKHLGIKIRQVDVDREDLIRLWPTAIYHGDQPNCHANDMPYILVTRACREDGIKVVLTGEGSDELFAGYPWQVETYEMWRKRRLHSQFVPNNGLFRLLGKVHPKFTPLDLSALEKDPFAHQEELEFHQERLRLASSTDGGRRLLRQESLMKKLQKVHPIEDRAFLARVIEDWYGNLQAVLHRNDRISMAASVESRPPFLENRLIDLGLHFPRRLKYHNGKTKWVVKTLAEKKIPKEIVHSRKVHFAVPMNTWRHAASMLQGGMVAELFKWGREETKILLDRIIERPTVIHNVLGAEIWARIFLRGDSPEELGEQLFGASQIGNLELADEFGCVRKV